MADDPMLPTSVARAAGQAALNAATVAAVSTLNTAAANAAKPGGQTTEWWAAIGGIALTGLLAGLKVAAVLPGPWMLPALALSTGISVGAYALSRGNVKAAALQAAAAAVATVASPPAASSSPPALR